MLKLPENTSPEFVSQLATDLSKVLKDKYNKPIGSGKLINDLSKIFCDKDWNTLNAALSAPKPVVDLTLFDTIAKDLLNIITESDLGEYWKDTEHIYKFYTTGAVNELYDVIFYHFGLKDTIMSYSIDEDNHNYLNQIPKSFKEHTFEKLNDLGKLHFTDRKTYKETDGIVCYRAIKEMIMELLCQVCRSIDDDFADIGDNDFCICNITYDEILTSFKYYLTDKRYVRKQLS